MSKETDSSVDFEPPAEESIERDYSIIWTSLPLPRLLHDRFNQAQARIVREERGSWTNARGKAKEIVEKELTAEEYESILAEIQSRKSNDSMMPPPIMRDAKETDPVSSPEAD